MMDPIERIANRLIEHFSKALDCLLEISHIIETSETIAIAIGLLRLKGYDQYVDPEHLDHIPYDIGRFRRCIDAMNDIKHMARKVFAVNFFDADVFYVFNQEISFSYTCKMMCSIGPMLSHFSNHPTAKEVASAELRLACNTRFGELQDESLLCLEAMPIDTHKRGAHPNSTTTSI